MTAAQVRTHPEWCDPRGCDTDGAVTSHRSTPMTWRVSIDDFEISVGVARYDEVVRGVEEAGEVRGTLRLHRVDSGLHRLLDETDMSAGDLRLLAAAAVSVAEQLEQLQRVAVDR
ncbi:hypothetical protein BJF78_24595 [Pseudonocardia sp. CNS-139]|nr:hypothetical protein BJF78_24595 [Pseudonocardia sp. CNS-139]